MNGVMPPAELRMYVLGIAHCGDLVNCRGDAVKVRRWQSRVVGFVLEVRRCGSMTAGNNLVEFSVAGCYWPVIRM
jgi:hypothetical protein